MFTAPRFIVVDDTLAHLNAMLETFQRLGSPCIGIHYDPATPLERMRFRGVRGLFLDLHLIGGELGSDYRRQYAHIASILEDNIHSDGGPFILVIWTQHPQLRQQLIEYLDANIDPTKPYSRPLAVLSLDKATFINLTSGAVADPEALRQAVDGTLTSNPQLAALINWETDVLAAAGATLSALLSLVPQAERATGSFPAAINKILSRLARASVGESNVAVDPRAAINNALSPILADRIMNQDVSRASQQLWSSAVTRYADPTLGNLSPQEAGQVNRMLHIAVGGAGETIKPTAWGTVVDFPQEWFVDAELGRLMAVTRDELLIDEFKVAAGDHPRCRPTLVRIGAACDHAQNQRGPIEYLFGLEIPAAIRRAGKASTSEWVSPILVKDGVVDPFRLHVNVRFGMNLAAGACGALQVRYRLREQLLMHLISHASVHLARPGRIEL